ncbi:TPA: hypothetical protein ACS7XE_003681 [Providencia alcalifaciens]
MQNKKLRSNFQVLRLVIYHHLLLFFSLLLLGGFFIAASLLMFHVGLDEYDHVLLFFASLFLFIGICVIGFNLYTTVNSISYYYEKKSTKI